MMANTEGATMKLVGLDLHYLRRALRRHPRTVQHVADLDIERMHSRELLAITRKYDIDARALIDTMREQDAELAEYSREFPAFEGRLEFDMTFELLGKRVTRKVRADYSFTPDWEYWDLNKKAPHIGWAQSMPGVTVRTLPSKDGNDGGPAWEDVDILAIGEIWDIIDDAIEERCKIEDAKRRQAAARKRHRGNGVLEP